MRVLLVEDDPSTQKSVKMMLESANMVVDTTDLGEDGLEIGKLYDYDIIVLDTAKLYEGRFVLLCDPLLSLRGKDN